MGYKILGKANEVKDQAEAAVSNVVEDTSSVVSDVVDTTRDVATKVGKVSYKMLGQARDFVEDVGDTVLDALPNRQAVKESLLNSDVKNVGDVPEGTERTKFGKVVEDMGTKRTKFGKVVDAVTSPVGRNYLNDLMFGRFNFNSSGKNLLSEGGKEVARNLLIDNGLLENGKADVKEEVYEKLGGGISVNQTGGSSASDIIEALAAGDPVNEAKLILGQFKGYIDENNDIIAEDQFNYNNFINPLDGVKYETEEYEAALAEGKFTEAQVLFKIVADALKEGIDYKKVRALGFVLGSKDYKTDDSLDQGRNFKINLGPAPERAK